MFARLIIEIRIFACLTTCRCCARRFVQCFYVAVCHGCRWAVSLLLFFSPYLPVSVRIWLRSQRYGALYLCNDMISSNLSSAAAISFGSDYNFVVIFLHLIHKNCHKILLVAAPLLILDATGCISMIFVKSVLWGY